MISLICILTLLFATLGHGTQAVIPTIKSNESSASIRNGSRSTISRWTLAPEAKPDIYLADLIDEEPTRVTFITDVDSINFMVELGQSYDFIIQWEEQACLTRITGAPLVPAAVFGPSYQSENRGKIYPSGIVAQ